MLQFTQNWLGNLKAEEIESSELFSTIWVVGNTFENIKLQLSVIS